MSARRITRHFATIHNGRWGHRQVHYRRVGSGPLVILLHQSPLSSRDMIATMQRWKNKFTCIAPDSPGYGLSDPLGVTHAEMDDFAEATIEFLNAIDVRKAAFYGFHTGAMIAVAIAGRYPERVSSAVANGYVIPTEAERADFVAHYLPAFEPSWDGAHLTWLWSRMREQTIFFPWYSKRLEDRLDFDVPSPEALQVGLVDFLRSGDHYRVGYRAAFTMQSGEALRRLVAPVLVTASATDPTARYLPRILDKSASVTVRECPNGDAALELAAAYIGKSRPPRAPQIAATKPIEGRLWQQMIDVRGGQLRVRRNTDAAGRTVTILHDAAGSADVVAPLAESFIGRRPVLAPDLPGHGESDAILPRGPVTVTAYARSVRLALDAIGVRDTDVVGTWGGGLVGLELARLAPRRVAKLVLANPLYFANGLQAELRRRYIPDIAVDAWGGHLLQAWHFIRDQGLFWPWYERTRRGSIRKPTYLDPQMIHRRVIELMRTPSAWRAAYRAHFSYPIRTRLRAASLPMLLAAPAWDPMRDFALAAAHDNPHIPFQPLASDPREWSEDLLPFLDA